MLTKNVQFSQLPDKVSIRRIGQSYRCRVDLAENIREEKNQEGEVSYIADIYSVEAGYTAGLKERVEANYDEWLAVAMEIPAPQPTILDVVEAVNALAEVVIGGEM